jgi:hypothetical protein
VKWSCRSLEDQISEPVVGCFKETIVSIEEGYHVVHVLIVPSSLPEIS